MSNHLFDNSSLRCQASEARSLRLSPDCDCCYPEWKHGAILSDQQPALYALELTPACNNRCPGCGNVFVADPSSRSRAQQQPPLPLAQWERLLDTIAPYAHRLAITGGEPTLHPDFAQIIHAVEQRELPFTLFTNGRWRDPQHLIALLQRSTHGLGLLISLHGAEAHAHEAFTGVAGSFAETVQHIQEATAAGLRVHTNTVLTHLNCDQVEAIVHLSQVLGAECAVFNRAIGHTLPGCDSSSDELKHALQQVDQMGRATQATRIGTCVPLCFAESSATGCRAGTAFGTIDPWGNVRPCNHAPLVAGNLLGESLPAIWQSEVMQAWRAMVPAACAACALFSTCRGGCRADALLKGLSCDPLIEAPLQVAVGA